MNAKNLIRWAKILFTPVALAFLVYFVWISRHDLAATFSAASFSYLLISVIAWCVFNVVTPLLAVVVFRDLGQNLTWRQALAIHTARLPARYVPGGVWHTVGRVFDYRDRGVGKRQLTAFFVLENGLAAALALALGGAAVFATREADQLASIAAVSSVFGFLALPVMFYAINNRVLSAGNTVSGRALSISVGLMAGIWMIATFAFLSYLNAFAATIGSYSQLEMGGTYLFSWGVGFVSVFAPQGIGVFEFVSSKLTESPLGFAGLAALIGGFRLIVLIADLSAWLCFQIVRRWVDDTTDNVQK